MFGGAVPVLPPQCVEPVRQLGPCPGEDGKSPGRTSPCGQSRYVLDLSHIGRSRLRARATGRKIEGRPLAGAAPLRTLPEGLEVHRRRQEHLPRIAVVCGQHAGAAQSRYRIAGAVQDVSARVRVLEQEVVPSGNVLLVQEVLAVDAEFVTAARRAPDEVRIPQGEARLVEARALEFKLLTRSEEHTSE